MALGCRYLRNRELVLGTYLVLSAAVTAYGSHRETLQLESHSALASLVWFSRAQSAEPLMLKSIIFAVSLPAHRHLPCLLDACLIGEDVKDPALKCRLDIVQTCVGSERYDQ